MLKSKPIDNKAQATLELSLVVGLLFLFLLGIVRIMGWFNSDMANRQLAYKLSRIEATQRLDAAGKGVPYETPALNVFGSSEKANIEIEPLVWPSYAERDAELQQEIEAIEAEGEAIIDRFWELKRLIPEHQQAARQEDEIAEQLEWQLYEAEEPPAGKEQLLQEIKQHRQAAEEHRQLANAYQQELNNIPNRLAALQRRINEQTSKPEGDV